MGRCLWANDGLTYNEPIWVIYGFCVGICSRANGGLTSVGPIWILYGQMLMGKWWAEFNGAHVGFVLADVCGRMMG